MENFYRRCRKKYMEVPEEASSLGSYVGPSPWWDTNSFYVCVILFSDYEFFYMVLYG